MRLRLLQSQRGSSGMFQQARSRLVKAKDAIQDTFFSTKGVFEEHKLVFTIGTSILSAGAAWAGYVGRQMHQQHVENRLKSIEDAMKSQTNLEDDQVLALTRTGVSFKACFATVGTASVITYILGWRSGRKFTLARIEKQRQKLLAAAKNPQASSSLLKRPLALKLQQRLILLKQAALRKKKAETQTQVTQHQGPEEELSPKCA